MTTIIFVHGTGVRDDSAFKIIEKALPDSRVVHCFWGETVGVRLNRAGASIPDYEADRDLSDEAKEESQWEVLYREPLFELIRIGAQPIEPDDGPPNELAPWEELKSLIANYCPSRPLAALLKNAELSEVWPEAYSSIIEERAFDKAVKRYTPENDEPLRSIARAMTANAIVIGLEKGLPLPDADARDAIAGQLARDFGQKTYKSFLGTAIAYYLRPLTWFAERRRTVISDGAFPAAGDILLYQRRGEEIRHFIQSTIEEASARINGEKVVVLAHSLGGIASFELLAKNPELPVKALITVGSQAPLLYELDCLYSLGCRDSLPEQFPRWLNIYDRQDLLSYIGEKLFPGQVEDFEVKSGQPFPISHSAYWQIGGLWKKVAEWLG